MKKLLLILLLLFPICGIMAQTGTWRAHMAYYDVQQIAKGGHRLYVRASNNLYSYNLNDQSITTYDKTNVLSDNNISTIAWNNVAHKLLIVYDNQNLDILDSSDEVTNLSDYYTKALTYDKTIYNVYIYQHYAYLCTGFGLVKINMQGAEVSESYILTERINNVAIAGSYIYAQTNKNTVLTASLSANLINPANWSIATTVPDGIFNQNTDDWDKYHDLVNTLQPGGPHYNYFNYMRFENNRLITTGGGWVDGGQYNRKGCAQILSGQEDWTVIENVTPLSGKSFRDVTAIVFDPQDANHYFISTCGTGIYEFNQGTLIKNHDATNSPLHSALDNTHASVNNYVRTDGLIFDYQGCLWVTCSAESDNKDILLKYNLANKEWTTYNNSELYADGEILKIVRRSFADRNGRYIWMANDHHSHPCMLRIDPENATITRYDKFTNQDGTSYTLNYIRGLVQDKDGNIWMGSDQGLFMYTPEQLENPSLGFTQIKVARNDGSELADYLMSGVNISALAIDGAGRKWVGTDGQGVYLISADNTEQLQHFTFENSPLVSNHIESIAINPINGQVFFGTGNGLCSYFSDANDPYDSMDKETVYAYPNPVPPGYSGLITITGLTLDADVKILSSSGKLITQGRSNGGMFTWNGRDTNGKPVTSGVYMVVTATSDGSEGTVCKIAIVR